MRRGIEPQKKRVSSLIDGPPTPSSARGSENWSADADWASTRNTIRVLPMVMTESGGESGAQWQKRGAVELRPVGGAGSLTSADTQKGSRRVCGEMPVSSGDVGVVATADDRAALDDGVTLARDIQHRGQATVPLTSRSRCRARPG
jgi:hypothetical protein